MTFDRLARIRAVRSTLRGDKVSIGSWMQIADGSVAEIMGRAGYDWIAVDLEHGAIGGRDLPDIFRSLELGGTLPLARLGQRSAAECKTALDSGAGGVIVPMVEEAADVERIVSASRWPPAGGRGVGFSRANLFGVDFERYALEAQEPLVVAQIENVRAVDNLEEILQVDGLDAIMIGPYDLSASIGRAGDFADARFVALLDRIRLAAARFRIPSGLHVVRPDPDAVAVAVQAGYRFIAYSIDAVFLWECCNRTALSARLAR